MNRLNAIEAAQREAAGSMLMSSAYSAKPIEFNRTAPRNSFVLRDGNSYTTHATRKLECETEWAQRRVVYVALASLLPGATP